jgi:hypothetical protein
MNPNEGQNDPHPQVFLYLFFASSSSDSTNWSVALGLINPVSFDALEHFSDQSGHLFKEWRKSGSPPSRPLPDD